jgi:hypothetical protein
VLLSSVEVLMILDAEVERCALPAEKDDFQINTVVWSQHVSSISQVSVSLMKTLCDAE